MTRIKLYGNTPPVSKREAAAKRRSPLKIITVILCVLAIL